MALVVDGGGTITGLSVGGLPNGVINSSLLDTSVQPIGVGQTWNYLTSSRALSTTYTNSTGRPIFVMAEVYCGYNVQAYIYINGTLYGGQGSGGGASYWQGFMGFIVPTGATYQISGGSNLVYWSELR